jgi:hypothetical protein
VAITVDEARLLKALEAYGFDGLDSTTPALIDQWLVDFPETWVGLALVEAVYQGRYKLISVQQILICWQRRGEPRINFDRTFERQILDQPALIATPVLLQLPVPVPVAVPLGQQPVVNRLRELLGVA